MGRIRLPEKVCLITAVCYQHEQMKQNVVDRLQSVYGPPAHVSATIDFYHTQYYLKEMGTSLKKQYIAFDTHIDPALLADIKIVTNDLEEQFSDNGKRTVNIDPGYIELAKLILASTKNFSHRIYIGKGIYGDVQLYWKHGQFLTNPWTYPDYKEPQVLDFFTNVRNEYWQTLKQRN